jgi:hypothetical protein
MLKFALIYLNICAYFCLFICLSVVKYSEVLIVHLPWWLICVPRHISFIMAAQQQIDLLSLLKDRLRGGDGQAARATALYEACCRVLESESTSSASLSVVSSQQAGRWH